MIRSFRKLEKLDKGYQSLLRENNLDYLIDLSNQLTQITFQAKFNFFGIGNKELEQCIMQFLIQRIIDIQLNSKILVALGDDQKKVNLGLPKKWADELEKEGYKSNTTKNKLKWIFFVLLWYMFGVYTLFCFFFKGLTKRKSSKLSYVYFDNLNSKNIPNCEHSKSKTIIDWYQKKYPNAQSEILHNVKAVDTITIKDTKVNAVDFPFKIQLSILEWIKFLFQGIWIAILSFYAFICGDFIHALLLKEFSLLYLAKKTSKEKHGKKYFFHNSVRIFRPLWTYVAEQKGAEVILYYYSTNNSPLKFDKGYLNGYGNKHYMSWNNVWVWNKYQKEYLEQYMPKAKIEIVGPIWFSSNTTKWQPIIDKNKIVSIFDIQTIAEETFKSFGFPDRHLTTSNMIQFHKDIIGALESIDQVKVILKRKRTPIKGFHDSKYLNFVDKHYNNDKFFQIAPDLDALTLIEHSFLTINYPATSTAYMAKHCGKLSIYYDPTEKVDKEDRTLCGVQLISGKEKLKKHIIDLF